VALLAEEPPGKGITDGTELPFHALADIRLQLPGFRVASVGAGTEIWRVGGQRLAAPESVFHPAAGRTMALDGQYLFQEVGLRVVVVVVAPTGPKVLDHLDQ